MQKNINLIILLLMHFTITVNANEPEFEQEFIRQQEQGQALRERMQTAPDVHIDTGVAFSEQLLPLNDIPCFVIDRVDLVGSGSEYFQWALKYLAAKGDSPIGKCLGANGISLLMTRLQNAIIKEGYITTRVYAGPQDLTKGVLSLVVVPGLVADIQFEENVNDFVFLWNAIPTFKRNILNLRIIEQSLENLKRNPTAEADIAIQPSKDQDNASDLIIKYQQKRPIRASASLDDSGSKSTGKYQGNITLSLDNPLRLSDLFYVGFSHDLGGGHAGKRGNEAQMLHYSVPYGYWLFSSNYAQTEYYQAVAGLTETYIYSGSSESYDLGLTRMLWRNASSKLLLQSQILNKKSWNYIDDTEVEVQRRSASAWKMGLNYKTRFNRLNFDSNLSFRRGIGALGAIRAPEESYGEGTTHYKIINGDAFFLYPFTIGNYAFRYSSLIRFQIEASDLLPQERFSIGGRYSVRGFDGESTLIGERGFTLKNDISFVIPGHYYKEIYLGMDYGVIDGKTTDRLVGKNLTGSAFGFKGNLLGINYDIYYGVYVDKPRRFESKNVINFALNYSI